MGRKTGQAGFHERNRRQRKRWGKLREARKAKYPKEVLDRYPVLPGRDAADG